MLEDILTNARILIVDDQETNNFLLENILTLNGYNHYKSLTDPRQVLASYAEYQPDLILLDLMMPHMDGFAVMEGLRPLIPADTYLPILVLTADVTAETKRRALSSGAFDFLTKPLDTVEVMLRIRNLLETRFLHLQLQNQNQILEQKVIERTAQLTESEAKHRILIEQIPAITYIDDPAAGPGETRFVSQQVEQLLGITPEEWIKGGYELWFQTIHAEDRERVLADYQRHFESGEPFECEYRLLARDGRVVWIHDSARMMRDKADHPRLVHGLMLDITERVQAEEAQRESEEKYRQLVEFAPDGILIHVDGEIVFANSAGAKILGPAAPKDLIGKPMLDFVHPDYHKIVKDRVAKIIENEQEVPPIEEKHVRLDGVVIDTEVKATPFRYGNKNAVQVVFSDITKRKQAEAALARRAEELAALQATVLGITASHDLSSLLQTIVERAAYLLQADGGGLYLCDPEKQETRCVVSYNTIQDYTGTVLKYGEGAAGTVAQSGKPLIIEDYRSWSGGAEVYKKDQPFRALVSVPMLWQGQVTGVLHALRTVEDNPFTQADLDFLSLFANHAAIAVENTRLLDGLLLELKERKQAEAVIEEQAERFRTMLSTITEGFWLVDDQGRLLDVNQAYCQMSAYSKDELLTLSIPDLEAVETLEATAEHMQTIIETGSDRFETVHKTKDGRVFDVEISVVFWPARRQFFVFIQDISERKQAERELKAQKEFAFQVMNTMGEGLTVTSAEGNFEYVNSTYARMLGYSSQQLIGRNLLEFTALEDQAVQAQAWIQRARGETSAYEVRLQRADGTIFPVAITGAPRIQDGKFAGSIAVVTDLTERKEAESLLRLQGTAMNAAANGIIITDQQGVIQWVNPAFINLTGYSAKEAIGQTPAILKSGLHDQAYYKNMWDTILSGEIWSGEMIDRYKDGSLHISQSTITPVKNERGEIVNFIEIKLDITERKQAEETLQQRARELQTLYESAMTISSNLSLEVVLKTVAEQVSRVVNTNGCAVSFWDQERDTLVTMGDYRTISSELADMPGTTYALKDYPAARRVLETCQPLLESCRDPQADAAELTLMEKLDMSTVLLLPLMARDRVIGLMEIYEVDDKERVFKKDEIRLAQSLSAQTAIFIDNARLFEQAERRLRRTEALHKIDIAIAGSVDVNVIFNVILDQAFAQLGMDAIGVLLFDPVTQVLQYAAGRGFRTKALQETHLPLGQGYAGRAALERKTIHVSELQTRKTDFLRSPSFSQEEFVSYYGVPLVAKGQIKGVLEIFHRRAFEAEAEWLDFLETLAGQTAIAIDNATLFKDLQLSNIELTLAYDATIEGWSHAMDLRDKETQDHTLRVTQMTERLARALGIDDSDLVHIRRGALLHDIGKMGVPDSVLLKADKLTDEEWELMRRHPQFAYDMLSPIAYLRPAMDIPYCHHEKWDGTGYPRGLKGEQIPLAARIFAVVDVYDALTSDRPYRKAWTQKKTLKYIREQSGTHFDPAMVDAFLAGDSRG